MKIAPSVLSLDYSRMQEQINKLHEAKVDWIHFDVMDGHFVPNLTFGPDILKSFKKMTSLPLDVHLMVEDPVFFADVFMDAGADVITFHEEAISSKEEIQALARHIRERGVLAGLSIKPKTDIKTLKEYLNDFDLFLIMSVEPGFGGQSFMMDAVDRIRTLKQWIKDAGSSALIEVDGGINGQTAKLVKEAGIDVLVAGSYIFKHDISEAVKSLES